MKENIVNSEDVKVAEEALIKHLAFEGELSFRRDQLLADHQIITQRLDQARQERQKLVESVKQVGGNLPQWSL